MFRSLPIALLATVALAVGAPAANAAVYLKVEGIKGDVSSSSAARTDEVSVVPPLEPVSHGAATPAGTGKTMAAQVIASGF